MVSGVGFLEIKFFIFGEFLSMRHTILMVCLKFLNFILGTGCVLSMNDVGKMEHKNFKKVSKIFRCPEVKFENSALLFPSGEILEDFNF